jgi:cysteine-S-conjugate beta-lyase
VVFTPGYHAFRKIIKANQRSIIDARLVEVAGRYSMDLDALKTLVSPRTKAVFFCSPHNPGGTIWRASEIRALAAFCLEHNLTLVSDEIHCDLLLDGAKHTPTIVAAPEVAGQLITCVAATKTFNLAGAHAGACITTNPALKAQLDARIAASGLGSYNSFGMIATEAGWRTGDAWLDALLPYLALNRDRFDQRVASISPGVRSMRLASTYLAWVDFAGTGLSPEDVSRRVKNHARIFASPGEQFGPGGETWLRFNLATPWPIVDDALTRLEAAFQDRRAS